ncbi:MAG: uroporphyrinogen-III synthase [Crocinitomicaceae bacterium]
MNNYLFISKDFSEVEQLAEFLSKKGVNLIAQSFIHFEPEPFVVTKPYDIIFFASPRSFLFFKLTQEISKNTLIACSGNKTAELITKLGHEVSFFGENSGNIRNTAREFKKWFDDKRVLFPTSDRSLQSVSSLFSDSQKEVVTVYKTKIVSKPLDYCNTYVFTSPSNVEGFLSVNEIPDSAIVYSWGESTTSFLQKNNIVVTETLKNSSIDDLIKLLS